MGCTDTPPIPAEIVITCDRCRARARLADTRAWQILRLDGYYARLCTACVARAVGDPNWNVRCVMCAQALATRLIQAMPLCALCDGGRWVV